MKERDSIKKPGIIALTALVLLVLSASCEKYSFKVETGDPAVPVSFQSDIQPIFSDNCILCHKGSLNPDLRDGFSYSALTSGGYVNMPAESSKLYTVITSSGHSSRTSTEEKYKILYWIQQGALENK